MSTGNELTVQKGEAVLAYHLNLFYRLFSMCVHLYVCMHSLEKLYATNISDGNSSAFSISRVVSPSYSAPRSHNSPIIYLNLYFRISANIF